MISGRQSRNAEPEDNTALAVGKAHPLVHRFVAVGRLREGLRQPRPRMDRGRGRPVRPVIGPAEAGVYYLIVFMDKTETKQVLHPGITIRNPRRATSGQVMAVTNTRQKLARMPIPNSIVVFSGSTPA